MNRQIKIIKGNICKKFIFTSDYENLLNIASCSFAIPKDNILFNYTDEDGDKIRIGNQFDLEHYIKINENDNSNTNSFKIRIEKINSNPDSGGSNGSHSNSNCSITQSLLMLNSNPDEGEVILKHDDYSAASSDLKMKIRNMLKNEVEEKLDEIKIKLINSVDNKLNIIFLKSFPVVNNSQLKRIKSKSVSNLTLKRKDEFNQCIKIFPEDKGRNKTKTRERSRARQKENRSNTTSSNNILNLNSISKHSPQEHQQYRNKHCRKCGFYILSDFYYNCLHCEDYYICNNCEYLNHMTEGDRHVLLKIKNPDKEHLESLQYICKLKKIYFNKRKFIKDKDKFLPPVNINEISTFSRHIAFNNFTDKIVIEMDLDETISDFYYFNINFVNLSEEIKRNSYLECIFEQSDIFGNKICFDDIVDSYEEFSFKFMFYNFKNKPSGYYVSKWKIVKKGNSENFSNNGVINGIITFIFYIKSKQSGNDFLELDILNYKDNTYGNKLNYLNKNSKDFKPTDANNKLKFPDLFSDIIKKHHQNKI